MPTSTDKAKRRLQRCYETLGIPGQNPGQPRSTGRRTYRRWREYWRYCGTHMSMAEFEQWRDDQEREQGRLADTLRQEIREEMLAYLRTEDAAPQALDAIPSLRKVLEELREVESCKGCGAFRERPCACTHCGLQYCDTACAAETKCDSCDSTFCRACAPECLRECGTREEAGWIYTSYTPLVVCENCAEAATTEGTSSSTGQ